MSGSSVMIRLGNAGFPADIAHRLVLSPEQTKEVERQLQEHGLDVEEFRRLSANDEVFYQYLKSRA